jgi:hypothetical protein
MRTLDLTHFWLVRTHVVYGLKRSNTKTELSYRRKRLKRKEQQSRPYFRGKNHDLVFRPAHTSLLLTSEAAAKVFRYSTDNFFAIKTALIIDNDLVMQQECTVCLVLHDYG